MSTYLVVGYEAYAKEVDEPITTKWEQYLTLYVKAAAGTDNTFDLGAYLAGALGTFWTAAIADATAVPVNVAQGVLAATTAGAVATAALAALQQIGVRANNYLGMDCPYLETLQRINDGGVLAANQYSVHLVNKAANVTFDGNAPTATTVVRLKWDLMPGAQPVKYPVSYF